MTSRNQFRKHLNVTLSTSICIFRSINVWALQKVVYSKGIARYSFHRSVATSRTTEVSPWEAGIHKGTQLKKPKATRSCFSACNPFAHHHIHQAGKVRNETWRHCRQCCCGKLQLHSKASFKQKKVVKSLFRRLLLAILLTLQPDRWAPIHPTSEGASTSPQQNNANTGFYH